VAEPGRATCCCAISPRAPRRRRTNPHPAPPRARSYITHAGDTADKKVVADLPADIQKMIRDRKHPQEVGQQGTGGLGLVSACRGASGPSVRRPAGPRRGPCPPRMPRGRSRRPSPSPAQAPKPTPQNAPQTPDPGPARTPDRRRVDRGVGQLRHGAAGGRGQGGEGDARQAARNRGLPHVVGAGSEGPVGTSCGRAGGRGLRPGR
jgi:hypothetical protein